MSSTLYIRTNNVIKTITTSKNQVFPSINKAKRHSRTIPPGELINSKKRTSKLHMCVGSD